MFIAVLSLRPKRYKYINRPNICQWANGFKNMVYTILLSHRNEQKSDTLYNKDGPSNRINESKHTRKLPFFSPI